MLRHGNSPRLRHTTHPRTHKQQAPGADRGSLTGPFKKKCLILAILETDGRTHATAALGRVVIDLSEFASIDGQELRTFQVRCCCCVCVCIVCVRACTRAWSLPGGWVPSRR